MLASDRAVMLNHDGAIVPDPENIITGGHDNKASRTVAIRKDETINASALTSISRSSLGMRSWPRSAHQSPTKTTPSAQLDRP
jgi:hypothetical protein